MKYFSTRNNQLNETFINTLFKGLSEDGGLFIPKKWPKINVNSLRNKSYEEVALCIMKPFIGDEIPEEDLYSIIKSSYKDFSHSKIAPLVNIEKNKYILELFYGPTLAFKDYALQFLGNIFSNLLKHRSHKITILGATSGDTGSAAINAFKGKKNINVFILHPNNKVSEVQRKQMTTILDKNIFNIAIDGNFDDCQNIVKELFVDEELQNKTPLTAINSINWARIMAQIVYYFWAYLQLSEESISFIVPSGNFGNILSAHVAQNIGLPIKELHIVTNENDILHQIISKGKMDLKNVKQTYSPSMDIQISSNFERQIFETLDYNSEKVIKIMNELSIENQYTFIKETQNKFRSIYCSTAVSNDETLECIKLYKEKYDYLADPHTATGLSVLYKAQLDHPVVSLACAHPSKFADAIKKATNENPIYPKELENIFDKDEKMTILPNNANKIKSYILENS